jgi:hypothetical protein
MCVVELMHMNEPCFLRPLHFSLFHHYMQLTKLIVSRSFSSISFSNSFIYQRFETIGALTFLKVCFISTICVLNKLYSLF